MNKMLSATSPRGSAGVGAVRQAIAGLLAIVALLPAAVATTNIANTVHNLTPSGPGSFKAPEATGLCVFCHTPHNANPQQGLWNRDLSAATYTPYSSTTLTATVGQPTGSSRLCLSCHDGTLAMGTLRRTPNGVQPTLGLLTGRTVLGTDLSADHPISFAYDSALAAKRGELVDPLALTGAIKVDQNNELQCTACHDAHEDRRPNFLRTDTKAGALCLTCHTPTGWSSSTHSTSLATWNGLGSSPWLPNNSAAAPALVTPLLTVADNACESCHRPHAAGHGKALLAQAGEVANCTICHSGNVSANIPALNVQNEFAKLSHHPIEASEWTHTPKEDPALMPRHVACADCHNAHATNATPATAVTTVSGRLQGARGVSQAGLVVAPANFEYEVCYKCHGTPSATATRLLPSTPVLQRQDNLHNAQQQFDPNNLSYHPVAAIGKNAAIQILEPGYTASSQITCTSCHNNDTYTPGGSNPAGPHGSSYQPILKSDFRTEETVVESPQTFGLCYSCHTRAALIIDLPGKFPHARHMSATAPSSCAACHDSHGSRQYPHLINFMLADRNGIPVVTPSTTQKLIQYTPLAVGGQCTLSCHGHNHEPSSY